MFSLFEVTVMTVNFQIIEKEFRRLISSETTTDRRQDACHDPTSNFSDRK
jgi:hypothetical protein